MLLLKFSDLFLRFLVVPFSVATIWISVKNHQDNPDYGNLGFHDFSGLKYMVCISGVSAGYALFGAVSSSLKWLSTQPWLFFIADQALAYLLVTSMAAQVEFLYLAYKGDKDVSWSEACGTYANFCTKMKIAVSLHVLALCCFLLLSVISAYRLFRRFDPPVAAHDQDQPQITTTT